MPSDKDQIEVLKSRLINLSNWIKDRDLSNKNDRKNLLKFLDQLDETTEVVIDQLAEELDEPRDQVGFADFLSDIGYSVVDTQRQLDEQSRVYLEEIKPSNHINPAVYRIPKVSASIKFGMRKSKKTGFNLIVAQRSQEDERRLNQSLEFEILSVPPPPDYQATLSGEVPSIGFVFSAPVRNAVFLDIENYEQREDQSGLNKELLLSEKNRVLIMQIGPRMKPDFDEYLILYANKEDEKNVGIWSLLRDPKGNKKAVFEIILKFSASDRKGENYKLLRDLIVAHSEQQAKLLA